MVELAYVLSALLSWNTVASAQTSNPTCEFRGLRFPKDTVVYAAGGDGGQALSWQMKGYSGAVGQIDVTVNSPKPVALMLGAYHATIWNVGWTKGTKIVAVIVSGYDPQALAGLPPEVPAIVGSYAQPNACEYFFVDEEYIPKINKLSQRLFGKSVDTATAVKSGSVTLGFPLQPGSQILRSPVKTVSSFKNEKAPPTGSAGLQWAIDNKYVRPATKADLDRVMTMVESRFKSKPKPKGETKLEGFGPQRAPVPAFVNPHVILKKFSVPGGLPIISFIVEKGAPKPDNVPSTTLVYDLNDGSCSGPVCEMDPNEL